MGIRARAHLWRAWKCLTCAMKKPRDHPLVRPHSELRERIRVKPDPVSGQIVATHCVANSGLPCEGARTYLNGRPQQVENASHWIALCMPSTRDLVYDALFDPDCTLFGESPELALPSTGTVYRLLTLPSFRMPTLIRLDAGDGHWQITGKKLQIETRTSVRVWSSQRVLRDREQRELERLLDELDVWALPVGDNVHGLDGESWTLEAKSRDRYHRIERWSPGRLPTLATLGDYLHILARVPNDYVPRMGGEWRRRRLEERRASARAAADRQATRLAEIATRNELATALAAELEAHGLTCPHCQRQSRDIRYVQAGPDCERYFICRACGCSFTAREYE